jgi:hypothetical protein
MEGRRAGGRREAIGTTEGRNARPLTMLSSSMHDSPVSFVRLLHLGAQLRLSDADADADADACAISRGHNQPTVCSQCNEKPTSTRLICQGATN